MKKLAFALALWGLLGTAVLGAPTIVADELVYAVTVAPGSPVVHSFALTNAGDQTLTISSVRTSCGCTTTALAKRDLAPGESVALDATVNTAGFYGTVSRTITVSSNDPVSPSLVLRIDVTISDAPLPVPEISATDLKLVYFLLIDVRPAEDYAAGHLLGAMNVPVTSLEENLATWVALFPRDIPIVVYGNTDEDGLPAGRLLIEAGLANVHHLTGGLVGWTAQFGDRALFAF